jgi:opine dehydrogenase
VSKDTQYTVIGAGHGGMDSIVRQACIIHQTDYRRRGRTLDKLGIERLSVGEVSST